jgi:hypothetical protein
MTTNTEPLDASVTLEEIFAVVTQKRAPLTPELAGYLVLELAESLGAERGDSAAPGEVDPRSVYVSEEGSVALVREPHETVGDTEASLRRLLGKLLEAAGAQTPALASVARRRSAGGVPVLVEELEASLIPVNRSAGKRALARLARETKRVKSRIGRNASAPSIDLSAEIPPEPPTIPKQAGAPPSGGKHYETPTIGLSPAELAEAASKAKRDSVDSLLDSFEVSDQRGDKALSKELKAMVGLEPTKTPPPATEPSRASQDAIESLLAESAVPAAAPRIKTQPLQPRPAPIATSPSVRRSELSLTSEAKKLGRKPGSGLGIVVVLLLLVAAFAAALWFVKPGFLTGRTPEKVAAERAAAEAERARIAAKNAQPACHASLVVTGAPKDAEILVREGQAPVEIDHMPVGARLEFVATAEGYAPKRAIVPAGAAWDSASGKPRYDLPVQLDKSRARPGGVDRWPPGEPGTEVGGKGDPGVVHVFSSPKGAEIWLLAGIGPDHRTEEVAIDDIVACDTDIDVLVAGPTTYRKRLHVPASSFVPDPSGKRGVRVAHLAVK